MLTNLGERSRLSGARVAVADALETHRFEIFLACRAFLVYEWTRRMKTKPRGLKPLRAARIRNLRQDFAACRDPCSTERG